MPRRRRRRAKGPAKVTVESLQGRLATSHADTINFFANAGTVQSNRLIFTFVGLDDRKKPAEVPELIAGTDDEKRRCAEAQKRVDHRREFRRD